ncbi:MAG: hypothetical protein QM723_38765 [Myxococcaceae bacterium]
MKKKKTAPRAAKRKGDNALERETGGQGYLGGYDMSGNPYGGNTLLRRPRKGGGKRRPAPR